MRQSTIRYVSAQQWPNVRLAAFLDDLSARDRARTEDAAVSVADDANMMKCARCGLLQPEAERCGACGEHAS